MNVQSEFNQGPSNNGNRTVVKFLYQIEFLFLKVALRRLHKKSSRDDAWWIFHGEEIKGPYRLNDLLRIILYGCGSVEIARGSEDEEETVLWQKLDYKPLWLSSGPTTWLVSGLLTAFSSLIVLSVLTAILLTARHFPVALGTLFLIGGVVWAVSHFRNFKKTSGMPHLFGSKFLIGMKALMCAAASFVLIVILMVTWTPQDGANSKSSPPVTRSNLKRGVEFSQRLPEPKIPNTITPTPAQSAETFPSATAVAETTPQTSPLEEITPPPVEVVDKALVAGPPPEIETAIEHPMRDAKNNSVTSPEIRAETHKNDENPETATGSFVVAKWATVSDEKNERAAVLAFAPHDKNSKGLLILATEFGKPANAYFTPEWMGFARLNHLSVVGLSFQKRTRAAIMPVDPIKKVLREEFQKELPLLIYGFGYGADFPLMIQQSYPQQIVAWSANGASAKIEPQKNQKSGPGILASNLDEKNFSQCWDDFQKGRLLEKPWTWVSLPGSTVSKDAEMQEFSRQYFQYTLQDRDRGEWIDINLHEILSSSDVKKKPAVASFLPSRSLIPAWTALGSGSDARQQDPKVSLLTIDTHVTIQPRLNLILRLPPGVTDGKEVSGVLAFSTWEKNIGALTSRLKNKNDPIMKYADSRNLAVLTWNTTIVWKSQVLYDDLSINEKVQFENEFNAIARAWDIGVQKLSKTTGIPDNDFLLYGFSMGAHWGQRLAIRKPERFLAVHIHVANTFDKPTEAASKCLWLVTTGEVDPGYHTSRQFYNDGRQLGYSMIFKAGTNLGHDESPEIRRVGFAFFDYALNLKMERVRLLQANQNSLRPISDGELEFWRKDFEEAPFVGDFVNQDVYPKAEANYVPISQRIILPTKDLAQAWGDLHER